jgi:hypothetical protein
MVSRAVPSGAMRVSEGPKPSLHIQSVGHPPLSYAWLRTAEYNTGEMKSDPARGKEPKALPNSEAKKPCVACKCEIPADASLCSVCKSYQLAWKNWLQYVAGVVTLIVLTVSASFWLYEKVHAAFFSHENVSLVACSTMLRTAVVVNRGDRDVFVSHLQLWMARRTANWQAPELEINQTLAPGQFLEKEFPKSKIDSGEIVRGLSSAGFENLVSRAANNDPCLELDFFAGFDTHYLDLAKAVGGTLNTFDVGGYLEYWGARKDAPVRVTLEGKGIVRRSNAPGCR